jgi:AraC family transcriptional regulator
MTGNVQFVELGKLSVPGMRIKVRLFPTGVDSEQIWRARSNILTFSRVLADSTPHRNVANEPSRFLPAGPLIFRPRSAVWKNRRYGSQVLTVSSYFDAGLTSAPLNAVAEEMPIDDFSMFEMMQMLHDEVRMPGLASQELVSAIGSILRVKLSRLLYQRARGPAVRKPCRSVDIAMIHGSISASTGHLPTTAQLAKQFNTSRRSLLRLFKATTGTSPSRYIEDMKLDSAKTLLATSKLAMKQIAHQAGYSTASHFTNRFHQLTGLTPSEFRRRARRQENLRSE